MSTPESLPSSRAEALSSEVSGDVTFMKNSFMLPPEFMKANILRQNNGNLLVQDALDEVDYFYDDTFLPEKDKLFALQLAQAMPSERRISATTTVVRLLHDISKLPGFKTRNYGETVILGTAALRRREEGESATSFLRTIPRILVNPAAESTRDTQGKMILLDVLSPFARERTDTIRAVRDYSEYTEGLPERFGRNDKNLWIPKINQGIILGKGKLGIE